MIETAKTPSHAVPQRWFAQARRRTRLAKDVNTDEETTSWSGWRGKALNTYQRAAAGEKTV